MAKREFCDIHIDRDVMPSPPEVLRSLLSSKYEDNDAEYDPYVHIHENVIWKLASYIDEYYGEDRDSCSQGTESMRQRLTSTFGPMWQKKSVAEMLYEVSQWVDESGDQNSPLVSARRKTLEALAVYAGMREDRLGE